MRHCNMCQRGRVVTRVVRGLDSNSVDTARSRAGAFRSQIQSQITGDLPIGTGFTTVIDIGWFIAGDGKNPGPRRPAIVRS